MSSFMICLRSEVPQCACQQQFISVTMRVAVIRVLAVVSRSALAGGATSLRYVNEVHASGDIYCSVRETRMESCVGQYGRHLL